jgi:hypothetical protein
MNIKKEIIRLEDKHLDLANEFAEARTGGGVDLYKKRGGFKKVDIVTGALGEMAVFKLLKSVGYDTNKPDFTIHDTSKKSYSADLVSSEGLKFHVKSQNLESATRYEPSYLLQRTDPIIKNPDKNDFLVPVIVNLDTLEVEIYGTIPMEEIVKQELLGECKVEWLRKTKVAIYLKDLKSINSKKRWKCL